MRRLLAALTEHQHLLLALLAAWLILSSPWVSMLGKIPRDPGFFNGAHVWVGLVALLISVTYCVSCLPGGGWRLYFPWLSGRVGLVLSDLRGVFRGRIPAAEGGGLFGAIEGLALLALLATGLTGAGWLWTQATPAAMDWRNLHVLMAHGLAVLIVVHALTAALHVLDFIRD